MEYSLTYNSESGVLEDIALVPTGKESPALLHSYAEHLKVINPSVTFNELVKAGQLNECSDEAFERVIKKIKFVSDEIFDKQYSINVFSLCVRLMKEVLGDEPGTELVEDCHFSVQEFLDLKDITGEDRSSFYGFISNPCLPRMRHNTGEFRELHIDASPAAFYLPKQNRTKYIVSHDKVLVVTTYDPLNTWYTYDQCDDSYEPLAVEALLESCGIEYDQDTIDFLVSENVVLHSAESPVDIFKDKTIELYVYNDSVGNEALTFMGFLKPIEVTVNGGEKPDFVFMRLSGIEQRIDLEFE